jgi:hypothetical protein
MGFNFGAFAGGIAGQVVKDIEDKENEIKLMTRKILDRQVEQTLKNQDEYKKEKKKVKEQISSLASLFGDDPDRFNKARAIVAGGDSHYNYMFKTLSEAQQTGSDINEIYKLVPNKDAVGFTGVEDATNSLVEMAKLPEVKMGEATQMGKMFGLDPKKYYEKQRGILEGAGQLNPVEEAGEKVEKLYQTGNLNLGAIKKEYKTLDEMIFGKIQDRNKLDKNSEEYKTISGEISALTEQKSELDYNFKFRKEEFEYKKKLDEYNKSITDKEMKMKEEKNKVVIEKYKEEINQLKNDKEGESMNYYQKMFINNIDQKVKDKFGGKITYYKGQQVDPTNPNYDKFKQEYKQQLIEQNIKNMILSEGGIDENGKKFIEQNYGITIIDDIKKQLAGKTEKEDKTEVKVIPKEGEKITINGKEKVAVKVTEDLKKRFPQQMKNKSIGDTIYVSPEAYEKLKPNEKNVVKEKKVTLNQRKIMTPALRKKNEEAAEKLKRGLIGGTTKG